jgi:hypothetical protein
MGQIPINDTPDEAIANEFDKVYKKSNLKNAREEIERLQKRKKAISKAIDKRINDIKHGNFSYQLADSITRETNNELRNFKISNSMNVQHVRADQYINEHYNKMDSKRVDRRFHLMNGEQYEVRYNPQYHTSALTNIHNPNDTVSVTRTEIVFNINNTGETIIVAGQ